MVPASCFHTIAAISVEARRFQAQRLFIIKEQIEHALSISLHMKRASRTVRTRLRSARDAILQRRLGARRRNACISHSAACAIGAAALSNDRLSLLADSLWKHRASLASPFFVAALLATYLLYMQTFEVTHPYNGHMNFMRNALLNWAVQNNLSKSLFFLPMALALGCIWTMPLQRRAFWVLVPLVCAMLIPEALIEQRYAILPIALWTLLRRDVSQLAEALNAAASAALATTALMWIAKGASI